MNESKPNNFEELSNNNSNQNQVNLSNEGLQQEDEVERVCLPEIGSPAPKFTAMTTFGRRSLTDYRGSWLVFFSHPGDFTPV